MEYINIPDELWQKITPYLPNYQKSKQGGRPRLDLKRVLEGIIYVCKTKCTWKSVPSYYGSGTSLNDYYREWKNKKVFDALNDANIIYREKFNI